MRVKGAKRALFLHTSSDIAKIPKELHNTAKKAPAFLSIKKGKKVTSFQEGMQVLVIHYLTLSVTVPVTGYCYLKCNKNVTSYYKM